MTINWGGRLSNYAHFERDGISPPPDVTQCYEPALDAFLKHVGLHRMVASQSLLAATLSGLFAAPRALRHLIETYDISARGGVEVLYIGIGAYETFDQGRWFSLYEQLVPAGRSVRITGIGMDFTDDMLVMEMPFARLCDLKRQAAPCLERVHVSSLGEAFQQHRELREKVEQGGFDLIVAHHPGILWEHSYWADDPGLKWLLDTSPNPLFGTAFSACDLAMDAHWFTHLGHPLADPIVNPEPHDKRYEPDNTENTRWGHVLWRTDRTQRRAWAEGETADTRRTCSAIKEMELWDEEGVGDQRPDIAAGTPGEWAPDNRTMYFTRNHRLDTQTGRLYTRSGQEAGCLRPPQLTALLSTDRDPISRLRQCVEYSRVNEVGALVE